MLAFDAFKWWVMDAFVAFKWWVIDAFVAYKWVMLAFDAFKSPSIVNEALTDTRTRLAFDAFREFAAVSTTESNFVTFVRTCFKFVDSTLDAFK